MLLQGRLKNILSVSGVEYAMRRKKFIIFIHCLVFIPDCKLPHKFYTDIFLFVVTTTGNLWVSFCQVAYLACID